MSEEELGEEVNDIGEAVGMAVAEAVYSVIEDNRNSALPSDAVASAIAAGLVGGMIDFMWAAVPAESRGQLPETIDFMVRDLLEQKRNMELLEHPEGSA